MPLLTSNREKKLWLYTLFVLGGIIASIFLGKPITDLVSPQFVSNAFWIALWAVLATAILHGLITKRHALEIALWLGIFAVYLLVFLRMAIPEERSHLIEYSVLAIVIFEALKERHKNRKLKLHPAIFAFAITSGIGALDEFIQLFVPGRVFDWIDIGFNAFASLFAISSSLAFTWAKSKIIKT